MECALKASRGFAPMPKPSGRLEACAAITMQVRFVTLGERLPVRVADHEALWMLVDHPRGLPPAEATKGRSRLKLPVLATSYPQATLRWNNGINNFMIYGTGDIPVGPYQSTRLANLGIGHGAADGGAGYTYLIRQKARSSRRLPVLLTTWKIRSRIIRTVSTSTSTGRLRSFCRTGFCRPSRLRLRSTVVSQRLRRPRRVL